MKNTTPVLFPIALLAMGLLALSHTAVARPYASGLANDAGTISFRLNESADSVKVISDGGATTNDLGALAAGPHSFPLGISGVFRVEVFKTSGPGFTTAVSPNRAAILQISTDNNLLRFTQPRGLAINTDPTSPYFGRVYVANGAAGTTTTGARSVGDGIYVLNPDLSDALGQGDAALTGGLDFATGGTVSPYRLSVGKDGNLYISDWSDTTGSLYVTDPNVSTGSGGNVLGGPTGSPFPVTTNRIHGSIAAAIVTGSLANGDLTAYVIDEDLQLNRENTSRTTVNSFWRHDIGAAIPGPEVMPTFLRQGNLEWINFASQTMDLSRGTNGYFYVNDYRSAGTDRSGLTVVEADGTNTLWSSREASRTLTGVATDPDFLRATGGGDVSPLGDYVAVINIETNGITVVPLLDGLPDITNRLVFHGMGVTTAQGRDVAFDAAGNLYAVSQGAQLMRVFSPGGTSTAITGSDGTFTVIVPPSVRVFVNDGEGYEDGPDTLSFTVMRSGDTASPLTVNYTLAGTAGHSVDYATDPLTVTIPAGQSEAIVTITPIDDAEAELNETVTLTLVAAAEYNLGSPFAATGTISDNEAPTISIVATSVNPYERFPDSGSTFVVTRRGTTNADVFVVFEFTGTATINTDYLDPMALYMPLGSVTTNLVIAPLDDTNFEGNETVILTLIPNGYEIGTPGAATTTIIDDECPPETVLFGDNLNIDSSANWTFIFGANTNTPDYNLDWAFDYSTMGIPSAPGSAGADSTGLRMTVNKNDSIHTSAAINLYPTGQSFSGDYALRFDLFIDVGNSNSTEHTLAGINHSGNNTNRVSQTPANHISTAGADGIWFGIEAAAANLRDYAAYTSTNSATVPALIATRAASTLSDVITRPPYSFVGSPGNASNSVTKAWAQVEISQTGNIVSLKVNKRTILSVTNTYGFNSGNVMIGYNDQFDSRGSPLNFAIFDNVRVIRLGISITDIERAANTVQIDFTSSEGEQAGDFRIESTETLSPPSWSTENGATIVPEGNGFRATVPATGDTKFYRVAK